MCLPCVKDYYIDSPVPVVRQHDPYPSTTLASLTYKKNTKVVFPDTTTILARVRGPWIYFLAVEGALQIDWVTRKATHITFFTSSQHLGVDLYPAIDDCGRVARYYGKSGTLTISDAYVMAIVHTRSCKVRLTISTPTTTYFPFCNLGINYHATSEGLSSRIETSRQTACAEYEAIIHDLRLTSVPYITRLLTSTMERYYPLTEATTSEHGTVYWTNVNPMDPREVFADYSPSSRRFRGYRLEKGWLTTVEVTYVIRSDVFKRIPSNVAVCAMWRGKRWFHLHSFQYHIFRVADGTYRVTTSLFLPLEATSVSVRVNAYSGGVHTPFQMKSNKIPGIEFERMTIHQH